MLIISGIRGCTIRSTSNSGDKREDDKHQAGILVESAAVVLVLADSAVSDGFCIVHAITDGLGCSQVRKDGLEIVVRHVPKIPPWHGGVEFPRAYHAGLHNFQEKVFVVIAEAGRIGGQVCAGHVREWTWCYKVSPAKLKTGKRLPGSLIAQCMAPLTSPNLNQICATLYRRGLIRLGNRGIDRNGVGSNDFAGSRRGTKRIPNGRNGAKINNDRRQIFIRHQSVELVGHCRWAQ